MGTKAATLAVVLSVSLAACSAATMQAVAAGLAAASGSAGTAGFAGASAELLLFGGEGHKTFIGCLNCSKFAANSVTNTYGDFGSRYSSTSLFNAYSDYGSKYSDKSACNPYASDPPVIVDRDGKFYGRLTLNKYRSDAVKAETILAWLAGVCQH